MYPIALFQFMSAYVDDEASDGAWQQMLENAVDEYNRIHKTNYDSLDAFIAYCEQ